MAELRALVGLDLAVEGTYLLDPLGGKKKIWACGPGNSATTTTTVPTKQQSSPSCCIRLRSVDKMGPQSKKRKLQTPPTSDPKRAKSHASKPKPAKASKASKPRRAVDANALAWNTIDEDEFGALQVIDNVDVVKDGGKVKFLVKEEKEVAPVASSNDEGKAIEDDGFEGFDDQPEAVAKKADGKKEDGDLAEEQPKDKKKAKQKKKQPSAEDAKLDQKSSFSALANTMDEENGPDTDVSAWEALDLSPRMLSSLAKLKFSKPTEIQRQAIPQIVAGEDVIGKAQTGSGKTLAFGIPIVEKWLENDDSEENEGDKAPTALVLSPTRELAKQLGDHVKALCEGLEKAPYVCVITGGLSILKQQRQLAKADIVIGTPGRLWEVMEGDAALQEKFTQIRFLVVDEADRLFKAGQFKEAEDIIGALDRKDPDAEDDEEDELPARQTLVFSATFDKDLQTKLAGKKLGKGRVDREENKMEYLMKCLKFRQDPKFIDTNPVRQMAMNLKEGLIECGAMEKDLYLYTVLLLNPRRRTLVFTNSISAVRRLTPFLTNLNVTALPLQSQMPQKARLRSLERFTEAKQPSVLVATDVAARGLDIPEVDMVLHYHVPRAADTYVHRSGRTARADRPGVSIILCSPDEVLPTRRLAGKVHAEAAREHVIQTLPIDRKLPAKLKARTDPAKKLADATLAKERVRSNDSFMSKAAEDLDVEYDSQDDTFDDKSYGGRGGGRKKKEKEASLMSKSEMGMLRAKLREELARRVNLGVSERYITGGRVDVAALLKERENGGGVFLGGEGLGLGFE